MMTWQLRHALAYSFVFGGLFPHYFYLRGVYKKIHKIYLMRGGKYCRIVLNEYYGEQHNTWITIKDMHLLNKTQDRIDVAHDHEFLDTEGQMQHETAVQMDFFTYWGVPLNDEVIYFMKEGKVHAPEVFEQVVRGYNIDDSDYEINTEDNKRWMEPTTNY